MQRGWLALLCAWCYVLMPGLCYVLFLQPVLLKALMGSEGLGASSDFGLTLEIYCCSEPKAKTSLDLQEAGLEENLCTQSVRFAAEISCWRKCKPSVLGCILQWWSSLQGQLVPPILSSAWAAQGAAFHSCLAPSAGDSSRLPCLPLVHFMTVIIHFLLLRIFGCMIFFLVQISVPHHLRILSKII